MSLLRIQTVATSKSKRTYAKTLLGKVMFPADKTMELKSGSFAVCTSQRQTKKYSDDGVTLVDIPFDEQPVLNIVQAVFATKQDAVNAIVEESSLDMAVQIDLAKFAKENGLTAESLKELEASAV